MSTTSTVDRRSAFCGRIAAPVSRPPRLHPVLGRHPPLRRGPEGWRQPVELSSSSNVEEWPAGWHNGNLIVAVGVNAQAENYGELFEWGHGYHVVDAISGQRVAAVCDGVDSFFPPSPAGTECTHLPGRQDWELGRSRNISRAGRPMRRQRPAVSRRRSGRRTNNPDRLRRLDRESCRSGWHRNPNTGDGRAPGLDRRQPPGRLRGSRNKPGTDDLRHANRYKRAYPGRRILRGHPPRRSIRTPRLTQVSFILWANARRIPEPGHPDA